MTDAPNIEAHLKDGRVLTFPAGTDPAVVQQTVKKVLAGPPPNTKGSFLPMSTDPQGNRQFDSTAGVLGAVTDALKIGPDVASGEFRPSDLFNPNVPPNREQNRRAMGATMLTSPLPAPMRAGEAVIPGAARSLIRQVPKTPSGQMLEDVGAAGFEKARGMGVDYTADSISSLAHGIQQDLMDHGGLIPVNVPKTTAILEQLKSPPKDAIASLSGVLAARKGLQAVAGEILPNGRKTQDALAATHAIKQLDAFIAAPDEASVVAGPAAAAGATVKEAQGNYAAAMRSQAIDSKLLRAETRANVANSGHNAGNLTRSRIADLILNAKEGRGFSDAEKALMKQIADGKFGVNLARDFASMLGGGGGMGRTVVTALGAGGGAAMGGMEGAAIGSTIAPLTGAAIRVLYNKLVQRQVAKLNEKIRQRSPLYENLKGSNILVPGDPTASAAALRMLLLSQRPDDQGN